MKKLLTLIALMACFLGAKAQQQWEEVYSIDYTTYSGFPFYVMGYVPEFDNGCMTDYGAYYGYKTDVEMEDFSSGAEVGAVTTQGGAVYHKVELDEPAWHQYFIADGIPTQLDGHYKVVALVKASEAVSFNVNMGWGWGNGEQVGGSVGIPQSDDFVEVEWEYECIGGTSCNLVAQPGSNTATIEWQSLVVYHEVKATQSPVEWIEAITFNGDAESAWPDWALEETDGINANWRGNRTGEICAWALTMGRNFDDQDDLSYYESSRARPFPADIELEEGTDNHVFAVHVNQIEPITDDDPYSISWSNQFWIQSPRGWKSGTQIKLHFRYKAQHACSVSTLTHKQNPTVYLHWDGIGSVNFTQNWQTFDKTFTLSDAQNGGWSFAFNLCSDESNGRTPNIFYFDNLSMETMVLEEGLFVASSNTATGLEYDFDNAVPFEFDADLDAYVATAGTVGDSESWVNELMISTVAGNDAAFKGNTISPSGSYIGEDEWGEYTAKSLSKIKLPAAGVWQIAVDTDSKQINIVKLEGEADKEPEDIVTNTTEVVVHGLEREYTEAEAEAAGIEKPEHPGAAWDNEFFLVSNRELEAGEVTVLRFKYKASKEAKTTTQCHVLPGQYKHWGAIGDVNFTTGWQTFERTFTVPDAANGMQSIAFNMAEIKEACDYEVTDVQWYLACDEEGKTMENLIDAEGTKNFYVKEGAGTDPYVFDPNSQVVTEKLTMSVPKRVSAGKEFLVSIALDNERTDYTAFKMDIQVSDGITFVQELNDDEEYAYAVTLNADRKKSDHQLAINKINSKTLRIASFSSTNKTFKGNSGEIVSLKLKVDDWAEGSAYVGLQDAYFSTTGEQDVYMNDSRYYFTIVNAPEDLVISSDYYLDTNNETTKELKSINVAMRDLGNNYREPERYSFGALWVEGNSMLSVNDYKMAYSPYVQYLIKNYGYAGRRASSVLINNAPMRADNVSVNLTLRANVWQFISLPFDIKVSDIKWDSNDQLYAIYKYDGKKRADQDMQNTWVRMTADSTLQAGVGYIWQVPSRYDEATGYYYDNVGCELKARDNENKNNIFLNSNAEVKMTEYLSEFVQDRSWNLLGNPYPAYFASRAMDITSPFTVWNLTWQNYEAYDPVDDDYVFAPGEAFFIQRPLDQENITFVKEGRQSDGYSYDHRFFNGARQSDMTAKRSLFNLFLSDDEQMDRTRFVINEEASLGYEMDKDASKFASMNANAVQLYTIENGVHYAINERPLGKGEIALGMSTPKKGSYTLKLDTKVDNEVILVDLLTGVEVLLNEQDYTFTAEAGKTESRFMVRLGAGDTTGISSTSARSEGEAVIYDLSGRRIDNSQKPAANGLYIINGKKVVVK